MCKKRLILLSLIPLLLSGCSKENKFILALGGEGVPVGQYSSQILKHFDIDEAKLANLGHISYGANVKEVASQVKNQVVNAGMVYKTDAFSHNLTVKDHASSEMCEQVIYPIAVLKRSKNVEVANNFIDYLKTDASKEEFEKVGFTALLSDNEYQGISVESSLKIFAAASMTESLNTVIGKYNEVSPNVNISVNYDSSGTLLRQIQEGAECDIFLSAAQKQMNALSEDIYPETRENILQNEVVLVVPSNNPSKIESFNDLVNILKDLIK